MRNRAVGLLVAALLFACTDDHRVTAPKQEPMLTLRTAARTPLAVPMAHPPMPNEPGGMTPLTYRPFSASPEAGWHDYSQPNFSIVDDADAPVSPTSVGQAKYPAGFAGGDSPISIDRPLGSKDSALYVAFDVKLSTNFVGHPTGSNKILYLWVAGRPRIALTAQGTAMNPLQPQVELRSVPGAGSRVLTPNEETPTAVERGRWQRWELLLRTNTGGNADGSVEWWIDGVHVGSYRAVQFAGASENHAWELVQWGPIWGGTGGTVPADQYMWMDDFYASSGSGSTRAAPAPVSSVAVTSTKDTLLVGESLTLTATLRDSSNNTLTDRAIAWTTSDTTIATVSSSGTVQGVRAGTVQISATSEGHSGAISLIIMPAAPAAVASVAVTLNSPSLNIAQATQATATLHDANGNVLTNRAITWSSSNPSVATVNASGYVLAVAVGTASITAASEGKVGSATLTVTSPQPAPVASVTTSPASANLVIGSTVQLTALLKDASGNTLLGRVTSWSSQAPGVASVTSSGLVTAVSAGTTTITATSEGKTGSTAVTVAASNPGSGGGCSSGHTGWLWCDDFEQDRTSSYFEYDNASGQFVRAAGVGRSGGYGMRAHFNAGQVSAGSLKLAIGRTPSSYFRAVDGGTANYRELYWRVYVRNAPNWTGGGGGKFSRALVISGANWSEAAFAHLWNGGAPDPGTLTIEPASGTDLSGNVVTTGYNDFAHMRWLGGVTGPTALFDAAHVGPWYCVEAHARLNDAGQSNGVFEFWINGGLEARKTGMNWVGNYSAYGWNAVFLENYWNDGSPQAQDRFFDDFVVSTQPIGCS